MKCPVCNTQLVDPWGSKTEGIYIVSASVSDDEISSGRIWAGKYGTAFSQELARVGVPPSMFYFTALNKHDDTKGDCRAFMRRYLDSELVNAKYVLLLGTACSTITGVNAYEISGIPFRLEIYPGIEVFMATEDLKVAVARDTIGDFRHGFELFIKEVKKCLKVV